MTTKSLRSLRSTDQDVTATRNNEHSELHEKVNQLLKIVQAQSKLIEDQNLKIETMNAKIDKLVAVKYQENGNNSANVNNVQDKISKFSQVSITPKAITPVSSKTIDTGSTTGISRGKNSAIAADALSGAPLGSAKVPAAGVVPAGRQAAEITIDPKMNKNNKKKHEKIIKGANTIAGDGDVLLAAEKRAWLYVGRTSMSTTTESLKKFLTLKLKTEKITVEELNTENDVEKSSRSFKIGFNFDLLETVENPEFWPHNIYVRRFRFFRGSRGSNN